MREHEQVVVNGKRRIITCDDETNIKDEKPGWILSINRATVFAL